MAFSQFGVPEALLFQSSKIKKKYASFCYNNILVTVAVTVLSAFLLKTLIPFIKDTILSGVHESFIWLTFIILPFNLIFIFFTRLAPSLPKPPVINIILINYNLLII